MHFLIWETLSFNLIYVAACYLVGTGMCHNMVGLLQHYIMRQHLNINFKCIPKKTQQHTLKHSNENTTALYAYIRKPVFRCSFLWFNKICISPWHLIVKFFNDV